jgi:hypothetical protein
MAKKNVGLLLGLAAGVGLVMALTTKKAKASEAQPADLPARYMAALAHVIDSGGSYEEYHRIMAEAAAAGAFDAKQQIALLGRHPDAPEQYKQAAVEL